MAKATYKLTLGPLIDTIFVFEIGGKYISSNKLQGTLSEVFYNDAGIRIRLDLGGVENQEWSLEVSTTDANGRVLKTVPAVIEGKITRGGGSWFDRTCLLQ